MSSFSDGFVVLSGLAVIGFGLGTGDAASNGWMLTLYSLITIYISSRVIAYLLDGASYDKLLFIISENHHAELRDFIIEDMDREDQGHDFRYLPGCFHDTSTSHLRIKTPFPTAKAPMAHFNKVVAYAFAIVSVSAV